jgi:RecA-family ATPase
MSEVLQFENPQWLVRGLVHRESTVFLSAAPKTGKSLFALRLAASVSTGTPLFGYECEQGNVLYVAAERAHLMKPRALALREKSIPFDPERFKIYPQPVQFGTVTSVEQFVDDLSQHPALLIIDTLRRCYRGDENDSATMTQFCAGIETFCDLTGASAVVIHHDHRERINAQGRPIPTGFSGSGALLGSLDAYFSLQRNTNGTVRIFAKEANEGNDFEAIASVERVDLGDHTTFVMLETEGATAKAKVELEPLMQALLIRNPRITLADLLKLCTEDSDVSKNWPKLSKNTVSQVLNKWHESGMVEKLKNPQHQQQFFHSWIG